MRSLIGLIGVGTMLWVVVGCNQGKPGGNLPDETYVRSLVNKAHEVARGQIERFAKIEAQYTGQVYFHQYINHPFNPDSGIYLKWYRQFTDYEILDIYTSDSVLRPIIMEIRFNYQYMHTPTHHTSERDEFRDIDPIRLAEAETEFSPDGIFSVIRRYQCDRYGNPLDKMDDALPRKPLPKSTYPLIIQGWSPRDKLNPVGSEEPTTIISPALNEQLKPSEINWVFPVDETHRKQRSIQQNVPKPPPGLLQDAQPTAPGFPTQ